MAVQNNYITVAYKLYVKDEEDKEEELVEQCDAVHPFWFISNLGMVLPSFENGMKDHAKGEKFDFVIPCEDAYGKFEDELMFDVDKAIFLIDGKFDSQRIYEGAVVPMMGEDGSRFNATIIEIKDNAVTIDLNHPRAGQDLHFVGEIVENREATNEEVTNVLNMMSGQGGCGGCGGGGCNGGCGGSCGGGNCGEGGCGCDA